ncbi:MHYT domain-containing protein [Scytonema sp. PCC 10023]|uniref:MHYT domain-containing protein n=1 Tax=Scytonema sp. PCC 10023 TaxID=1680591 RepID=UPI0039C693FD
MYQADVAISSTYNPTLVTLSILIAVVASYTALNLTGRVTIAYGRVRLAWLIGGAITMGIGIWSMHFVAMLAFSLPMPIAYDVWTVVFSTLPAIVASGGALFLTSRRVLNIQELLIGGVLMGIGIASMHYIGMAAMRTQASTQYDPLLLTVSVASAIGASIVSLWMAFELRTQSSQTRKYLKILSAFVMGGAISAMHYIGMASASFTPTNVAVAAANQGMEGSQTWLAVGIGIATLVILSLTLLIPMYSDF